MAVRRDTRRRRLIIVAGILFVVVISASSLVRFYTDLLWFREVRLLSVFWRVAASRAGIGAVGGLVAGAVVWINLEVARRTAPRFRFVTPAGDTALRYRSMFQPYALWVNLGMAALVGLLTGISTSAAWYRFLLWRHAKPFGSKDPLFGKDASFFVFSVPFQRVVLSWAFGIVVVSLLLAVLAHLLNGSIEPEANRLNVRPVVKVHVSVLLGFLALLKAYGYQLAQYDLVFSPRGTVTGASYTDVHAQLPALRLLVVIGVVAAIIFFVNLRFRGWLLPGAALALWVFASIIAGALIPWAVQKFRVEPNESLRERPYIARNIKATREAYGLDKIALKDFPADLSLNEQTIADNQETIQNLRVWGPGVLKQSYTGLQEIRSYYRFDDVDIDRYKLDGQTRQIMISAREVDPNGLEERARNWVNTRLTYTHGYGIVATPAAAVTSGGEPDMIVKDLPPVGPPGLVPEQGALYYGEGVTGYSIVRTKQKENDYPVAETQKTTTYAGQGGVQLSNPLRRLAFSWRFGDANLLISNFITEESRVIMRRNILERAQAAAPFLRFDHDPYVVVVDNRLKWILDGYTTTDRYPYSQEVALEQIFAPLQHATGGLIAQGGTINYMRNSVKTVIDAYDGTMQFYVVDDDPIIRTYQSIFPEMFTPGDKMPDSIKAHLRFPEDLFVVQASQYRLYHTTSPERVYAREDVWAFPSDPVQSTETAKLPMAPYYMYMRLPDSPEPEFLLMLPFTPRNKLNLNGWVAARSDPGHYGELVGFSFPRGQSIEGPENVSARIEQDATVSQQFTLWNQAGSRVERGNLFVIPIGTSLVYVQPIYLKAEQSALPELKRVVVLYGNRIGFEPTLEASLAKAISGQPSRVEVPAGGGQQAPAATPRPTESVKQLLEQASAHFAKAQEALRTGDLATYQRENEAARQAVEEAQRRSG